MALPNIFTKSVVDNVAQRINNLTATTQPQWGKMAVAQMLAHCSVSYEMVYEDKHPKPNFFVGFILKTFVKKNIVNEVPYKKNSGTAPAFIIKDDRNFDTEKARLIGFIERTQALGEAHFDGKESNSFGNLTKTEWNNLFYKHLDHHLTQFGV
jgi:Protein of unknown function (DUF1569)